MRNVYERVSENNRLCIKEKVLRYLWILSLLLVASCSDDDRQSNERTATDSHIGIWKSDCFTSEEVDYWVETTYRFADGTFEQAVSMHEDETCDESGEPPPTEGIYTFDKLVVTTAGVEAPVFDTTWFYLNSSEINFESEMGLFVNGDILYLVHPRADGSYDVGFDLPFHKVQP